LRKTKIKKKTLGILALPFLSILVFLSFVSLSYAPQYGEWAVSDDWDYSSDWVIGNQRPTDEDAGSDEGTTPVLGYSSEMVSFRVFLEGDPVAGCSIEIYELPYDDYKGVSWTGADGSVDCNLLVGEYRYIAEYGNYKVEGDFYHIEYEEIAIYLAEGRSPLRRPTIKTALIFTVLAVVCVCVAVYGISKVPK